MEICSGNSGRGGRGQGGCGKCASATIHRKASEIGAGKDLEGLIFTTSSGNKCKDDDMHKDWSLLNQLRKEIKSLMLALSQKYSSWCFNDVLVVYPSLFYSINDNSSESGYSSNQLSSSTNDTADSDWRLREKNVLVQVLVNQSQALSLNQLWIMMHIILGLIQII